MAGFNVQAVTLIRGTIERVCSEVYDKQKPTAAYAARAVQLVFMTAAHESGGFIYRRQRGFGNSVQGGGAFGICQTEFPPVIDSLLYLNRRPAMRDRVLTLLDDWGDAGKEANDILELALANADSILATYQKKGGDVNIYQQVREALFTHIMLPAGDPLAFVLCRIHYYRQPGAIPMEVDDMAKYAKQYYNTQLGKAKWTDYRDAYLRLWSHSQG